MTDLSLTTARERLLPLPEPRRMRLLRLIHATAHAEQAALPNGSRMVDVGAVAHRVLDEHHVPSAFRR